MKPEVYQQKILEGGELCREEALALWDAPAEELCSGADAIRRHFCQNRFDLCAIINAKSGRCPENCKFCAQSTFYETGAGEYPLLSGKEILREAEAHEEQGVLRFSLVTSGKRLTVPEVTAIAQVVRKMRRETGISPCASLGLLSREEFALLKEAGLERVHNNLETSRRYFPEVCSTHTYDDKLQAIRNAQAAGLEVCSGGILGMGETVEDRVDMALELRRLGIRSVPLNLLNPIPGTPFAGRRPLPAEEMRKSVALFRWILPRAEIRLAGGRGLLPDKGRACFASGANAAITGDMLTTAGITVETDRKMLREMGFEVKRA